MDQCKENGQITYNLLDLSDCVLLHLFSFVDATCLYNLSLTCLRLRNLVEDSFFWRFIDARESPNSQEKIDYCYERIHSQTNAFCIRSDKQSSIIVNDDFFHKINQFTNLRILVLENQTICGYNINVANFPYCLEELSLRRTVIENGEEFFRFSSDAMSKLRVLLLDECNWVVSSCLMSIAKYSSLEILSLYNCKSIDNSVAYLSLSTQYGFKKLKILDARLSVLGNTLLRSIYKSPTLLAIYLQNDDLTYTLDYYKRQLQIVNNDEKPKNYDYGIDNGINENILDKLGSESIINLDDRGILEYVSVMGYDNYEEEPKSFLYSDPYYMQCTCNYDCGWEETKKPASSSSSSSSDDDDDNDSNNLKMKRGKRLKKKIRKIEHHLNVNPQQRSNDSQINFDNTNTTEVSLNNLRNNLNMRNKRKMTSNSENGSKKLKFSVGNNEAGPSGQNVNYSNNDIDDNRVMIIAPVIRPPTLPCHDNDDNPVRYIRNLQQCPLLRVVNLEVNKDNVDNKKIPLKRLSLRGYSNVTNNIFKYINNLNLELLDVTYTSCSKHGLELFLMSHPHCRIVHHQYCTCQPLLNF